MVFFVGSLIDMMVPDIPEEVEMKMKREHYMAKEALAENQVRLLFEDFFFGSGWGHFSVCSVFAVFGEDQDSRSAD